MEILFFLLVGCFAGLLAGLLGVGGGSIIVPALIFIFQWIGVQSDSIVLMAVATSLACIVLTSLSSSLTHHLNKGVDWQAFKKISLGIPVGAIIGVTVVQMIDDYILKMLIAVFAIYIGVNSFLNLREIQIKIKERLITHFIAGNIIGFLSIPIGIGGGTFTVPYLRSLNYNIRNAIGTSAACGVTISTVATIFFSFPVYSPENIDNANFIYWPAVLWISISSILFARLGAKLVYIMKEEHLKKIFGFSIMIVGFLLLF